MPHNTHAPGDDALVDFNTYFAKCPTCGATTGFTVCSDPWHLIREREETLTREVAKANADAEMLRTALGWFLNDERFQVAVGGNPIAVDQMLAEARTIYLGDAK